MGKMAAQNRRRDKVEEARKDPSTEEEEKEESTEGNEDLVKESDTESEGDTNNRPPPKKPMSSMSRPSSPDEDTESDSETDLQSDSIGKLPEEVKAVSKPMGEPSQVSKKAKSKQATNVQSSAVSSKRPADFLAPQKGNDSKRAKKAHDGDEAVNGESSKKTGDDTTESDSETDLQSDSIREGVKPVSKSMGEPSQVSKKAKSKQATNVQSSAVSSKRPADFLAPQKGNDSKRAKKEHDGDEAVNGENSKKTGDDTKRQLFQRLWSEDDEIAILKGMIEHAEIEGINPASASMNSFYEFIRKSLHIDASKSQLSEKIRRLKKKYMTKLMKSKDGHDRTFPKAHDQTCYDLAKKIWGTESTQSLGDESGGKVSRKVKNSNAKATRAKKSKKAKLGSPILEKSLPTDKANGQKHTDMEIDQGANKANGQKNIDMEIDQGAAVVAAAPPSKADPLEQFYRQSLDSKLEKQIMNLGSHLITGAKKVELDDKWKQLQVKEMQVYIQRLDYLREKGAVVLEALQSSSSSSPH